MYCLWRCQDTEKTESATTETTRSRFWISCVSKVILLGVLGIVRLGDDNQTAMLMTSPALFRLMVITAVESKPKDVNYMPLRENIRRLRAATDQNGKPLTILELPMPAPVVFEDGAFLSYANFYIANGIVLVPVFNDPNDRIALDILAKAFPNREVAGIYSGEMIWGFARDALHDPTTAGGQELIFNIPHRCI